MTSEGAVVTTTVNAAHLPRARVLAASLRRLHPEVPFVVLLLDEPDARADPFEVLLPGDIPGTQIRDIVFRYEGRVAAAASKPYAMRHLLERGHRRVFHLDADTIVTGDLGPLLDALDEASIVLTPHLLTPASGPDARARELMLVRAGVLNTGVLGVRADAAGEAFLEWWMERTLTHSVADLDNGLHLDQRWVDLAPGMFDGVHILRDPGVNVAYWNLAERPLRVEGDRITAGGHPCRLLHASGYDVRHPARLSAYAPELPAEGAVAGLLERYRRELLEAGEAEVQGRPWAFDRWADGTPIPPEAREAHRLLGAAADRFGDPFAVGPGSFRASLAGS